MSRDYDISSTAGLVGLAERAGLVDDTSIAGAADAIVTSAKDERLPHGAVTYERVPSRTLMRRANTRPGRREGPPQPAIPPTNNVSFVPAPSDQWIAQLPAALLHRLAVSEIPPRTFVTLADLGVSVNQGLRTGYNPFFYPDDPELVSSQVFAPYLRPAVRGQRDLADLSIHVHMLTGRVLLTGRGVAAHNVNQLARYPDRWIDTWRTRDGLHILPDPVSRYILEAETATVDRHGVPTTVPTLSAVAPNARRPSELLQRDAAVPPPPKWWHTLELKPRHIAPLIIPRVIGGVLTAHLNADMEPAVIDANFSTLTPGTDRYDQHFLLALLNSSWFRTVAELTGTTLGGGALKLEAVHLRALPVPVVSGEDHLLMKAMGRELAQCGQSWSLPTLAAIDGLVTAAAARDLGIQQSAMSNILVELHGVLRRRRDRSDA